MSKLAEQELLQLIKDSFEEQKHIKVLSLYIEDDKVHGVYILPPQQSLSFFEEPLLDMVTDIDGYTIIMEELGQLLLYAYHVGSITHFFKLTHVSDINIVSKSYDNLVSICSKNPPLQRINTRLIDFLTITDEVFPLRTQTFNQLCDMYNQLDSVDVDNSVSTDTHDDTYIRKQFNDATNQLRHKKHDKITELIINEINDLYVGMQIDLYMTDDK